jgi:hypothetical protein
VVVEIQVRTYTKKDNSEGKASNISFNGIWKLDDPVVESVPRPAAQTAAQTGTSTMNAGKQTAAAAAAAAAAFEDL